MNNPEAPPFFEIPFREVWEYMGERKVVALESSQYSYGCCATFDDGSQLAITSACGGPFSDETPECDIRAPRFWWKRP